MDKCCFNWWWNDGFFMFVRIIGTTWCLRRRWASSRPTSGSSSGIQASSGRWSSSAPSPTSPAISSSKTSPINSPRLVIIHLPSFRYAANNSGQILKDHQELFQKSIRVVHPCGPSAMIHLLPPRFAEMILKKINKNRTFHNLLFIEPSRILSVKSLTKKNPDQSFKDFKKLPVKSGTVIPANSEPFIYRFWNS